ncbi:type IV secretory system conjugative DNA transfer family protein [Nocardiopsis sp. NPDC055551]
MSRELVSLRGKQDDKDSKRPVKPRLRDYMRPWSAIPILIPAGYLTHWLWGDLGWGTGLAAAGILAAGAIVTYATHSLTEARTWYAHHIAVGMTSTATGWLTLATLAGPGRPVLDIMLLGGATLAAIANVHLWAGDKVAPETPKEGRQIIPWAKVKEVLSLRGVSMRVKEQTDAMVKGTLEFEGGATVDDLQRRRQELASLYKVAPGAVRITEDPDRADKGELVIITKNVMKELIPWPGLDPKMVGASLADGPLGPLGLYEDGTEFFDGLDDRHTLTVGMSGSGKSVYGKVKILNIAARKDTFVCAIDLSKGRQTLGPVGHAIGWTAFDKKSAKAMLKAIERAATARADYLGSKGLPGWTRGCGLSFLHILIEEAAELVDFDELVKLGQMARSAGIHLEVSLQRATYSNIDTDARANFGDSISFGVKTDGDASFALPDYVLEAGAEPHRWQNFQPGSAYAAVREAAPDRHTTPIKMFGPPTTDKEDENTVLTPAAESLPDQDGKLDDVTRKAFGKPYTEFLAASRGAAPAAPDTDDIEETPAVTEIEDQEDDDREEIDPIVLDTEDDNPDVVGDLDTELAPVEGEAELILPSKARKGTQMSAEKAKAAVDSLIEEWGVGKEFTTHDLKIALRDMGVERGKSWLYGERRRLAEAGQISVDDSGTWTVQETRELASV